ncbi:Polar-differentiation response regulator DivK [Neomoorella glycerini]|uniref:Stage 0 sporulation protein A homolog n=1 Tax=Neomoorella glycerini TaxID=55779 RepID=A0A6I5ZWA5_9FIRM|nr:response regulator [Moorella glycerini]QGP93979.1 Polar-differentiation response regulator DivK [Moorella glycerini]
MAAQILVVEDNEANRVLLRDILAINGYEVLEAANGEEGVRLARERRPHLILMDIQLPRLDGISATKILKNDPLTRDIPVIAVSSYAYEREKEFFRAAGGNAYLTKPIDIDAILQALTSFLGGEKAGGEEAQNPGR